APSGDRGVERRPDECQLCFATDEWGGKTGNATRSHQRQRAKKLAAVDACRLPLGLDPLRRRELARPRDQRSGALADEDLVRVCRLLETRSNVHDVAADERAALPCPADHDLAAAD